MFKKTSLVIFFILTFLCQIAFSQIFGLPVPSGTKQISKANQNISGIPFEVYQYNSSLSQSQILEFYQGKLKTKGWSKIELPGLAGAGAFGDRVFNFAKGDELMVLNFSPLKAEELIFYTISIGEYPKISAGEGVEKQPLDMFKEPKSLDFMPIYPGSRQVDYREAAFGLQVGYMASGGVEAVKGFYLQKMPGQGWSLSEEKYIGEDQYDLSKVEKDCPTCPKIPLKAKEVMAGVKMTGVNLEFKQSGKTCHINITEMGGLPSFEGTDLTSLGLGDTIITVIYHDKK